MFDVRDIEGFEALSNEYEDSIADDKLMYKHYLKNADKPISAIAETLNVSPYTLSKVISTGLSENWANL